METYLYMTKVCQNREMFNSQNWLHQCGAGVQPLRTAESPFLRTIDTEEKASKVRMGGWLASLRHLKTLRTEQWHSLWTDITNRSQPCSVRLQPARPLWTSQPTAQTLQENTYTLKGCWSFSREPPGKVRHSSVELVKTLPEVHVLILTWCLLELKWTSGSFSSECWVWKPRM